MQECGSCRYWVVSSMSGLPDCHRNATVRALRMFERSLAGSASAADRKARIRDWCAEWEARKECE